MAASYAGTYDYRAGVVCLLQPHARPASFEHVRRSLLRRNTPRTELFPLTTLCLSLGDPSLNERCSIGSPKTLLHSKIALAQLTNHHSHYRSWRPFFHQYPASSSRSSNPSALSLASSPPSSTPRTLSKANYPRHPRLLYGQQLPLGWWPFSLAIFTACLEW